jgi:hypothetical protein
MAKDLSLQQTREKSLKEQVKVRKALTEAETQEIRNLKQLFKQFDVDGDGRISQNDLRLAIAKYGYSASDVHFILFFFGFVFEWPLNILQRGFILSTFQSGFGGTVLQFGIWNLYHRQVVLGSN